MAREPPRQGKSESAYAKRTLLRCCLFPQPSACSLGLLPQPPLENSPGTHVERHAHPNESQSKAPDRGHRATSGKRGNSPEDEEREQGIHRRLVREYPPPM